ncbi:MAG: hypothetical protein ACODAJ_03805, partial [Planctomycetota bacterium]
GLVCGLTARWYPRAELIEGATRGQTKLSLRREIPRICAELGQGGARYLVFLTDADEADWREKRDREVRLVPERYRIFAVYAVADRNVECWLAADPASLASALGVEPSALAEAPDPKGIIESALRPLSRAEKIKRVADFVASAPLPRWIRASRSFRAFYEDVRALTLREECEFPNEREG